MMEEYKVRAGIVANVYQENWYNLQGRRHRDERPAITEITYEPGKLYGETIREEYYSNGRKHGPRMGLGYAVLIRDGDIEIKEWYYQGRRSRDAEDAPAVIHTNLSNGIVVLEEYYSNNQLHRFTDGPAVIVRDQHTGEITEQRFYRYGTEIQNPLDRQGGVEPPSP